MDYRPLARDADAFQQPPDAAQISALAARLLGDDARLVSAHEIGGGAFNNAFRLEAADGRRWALRVSPPRHHPHLFFFERHLLRREHSLAPWLAAIGPWLPRVAGVDFTGVIFPRDAVIADFIEGENWDAVRDSLPAADNDALWRELAGLLRRVHATPAPHFGWTHPETAHARWSDFILTGIRGLLADFTRFGLGDSEARAWAGVVEGGVRWLDEIKEPRVLHGDPWPKNVLIRRGPGEGRARIVALLDHERGLFGDPLYEWVFHGCDFPPVFWGAYGSRPADAAGRFRAWVYRGMVDLQCLLEVVRYRCDAGDARERLRAGAAGMRRLLAELGP